MIHLLGRSYELGIEHDDTFRLLSAPKIPTSAKSGTHTRETGTRSLDYIRDESDSIVGDLGTFEVVEGSFEKGHLLIYLSGRNLTGKWLLRRA